jgi:hypothetical protein
VERIGAFFLPAPGIDSHPVIKKFKKALLELSKWVFMSTSNWLLPYNKRRNNGGNI